MFEEEQTAREALVVEPECVYRSEIVEQLACLGRFDRILEAKSLRHGLLLLDSRPFAACLLGPSLGRRTAAIFLRAARRLHTSADCALVVVLNDAGKNNEQLFRFGADGIVQMPFEPQSFASVIRNVRSCADERRDEIEKKMAAEAPLSESLERLAWSLRTVAQNVTSGELKLLQSGEPSPAVLYALHSALKGTLSPALRARTDTIFETRFVSSVTDWFADRVNASHPEATERLRQRLLAYLAD